MEKNILFIRYFVRNIGIFHGKVLHSMEVYRIAGTHINGMDPK